MVIGLLMPLLHLDMLKQIMQNILRLQMVIIHLSGI